MKNIDISFWKGQHWYHTFYLKNDQGVMKQVTEKESADIVFDGEWNHNQARETITEQMAETKGKSLADIGCLDGFFSLLFQDLGAHVTAVDIVDRQHREIIYSLLGKRCDFRHANVYQLDKACGVFDYIWMTDCICHLDNPLLALKILRRSCRCKIFVGIDRFSHEELRGASYYVGDLKDNSILYYLNDFYTFLFSENAMKRILNDCGFMDPVRKFSYPVSGSNAMKAFPERIVDVYEARSNPDYDFQQHKWKALDFVMLKRRIG